MITYGTLNRIRYRPRLRLSTTPGLIEFEVPPRPDNILELERCHLFGRPEKDLKLEEMRILMMFDQIEPLVNRVRNELDFRGKLKRLMNVCHLLPDSKSALRNALYLEAQTLLSDIEAIIQDTMSPIMAEQTGDLGVL